MPLADGSPGEQEEKAARRRSCQLTVPYGLGLLHPIRKCPRRLQSLNIASVSVVW
jgi:hypothetical protein